MNGNIPPSEGSGIPWRHFRRPVTSEDLHYVECTPDLHIHDLLELDTDMLAALGVKHLLFDLDGTLVPNAPNATIDPILLAHLHHITSDDRFASLSLATDNRGYLDKVALQIGENVRIFQPTNLWDRYEEIFKFNPIFYQRILYELGCSNTPQAVAMIGDSPRYDIFPAQQLGIKTVLVDRLERDFSRT